MLGREIRLMQMIAENLMLGVGSSAANEAEMAVAV